MKKETIKRWWSVTLYTKEELQDLYNKAKSIVGNDIYDIAEMMIALQGFDPDNKAMAYLIDLFG